MRIQIKSWFVKVCDGWLMGVYLIDGRYIVNKIPVGATEKPYMKSIYPTLGIGII